MSSLQLKLAVVTAVDSKLRHGPVFKPVRQCTSETGNWEDDAMTKCRPT